MKCPRCLGRHAPDGPCNPGWYHNASDSFETQVVYCKTAPDFHDSDHVWTGPFESFTKAKQDAIKRHREGAAQFHYAIALLGQMKKPRP